MSAVAIGVVIAALALAQEPQKPAAQPDPEQQELLQALTDANSSSVDLIRVLEAFLKKHPQSAQRKEIERVLAKAAIESQDDRRTVLYGEKALAESPNDLPVTDRVAHSLLVLGGRDNAEKAIKYADAFEQMILKEPAPTQDAAHRQDERDRALGRALLYQSSARTALGDREDALRLAAKSFSTYPTAEAARAWSDTLGRLGRDEQAIERLADAFAIPDPRSTEADRAADRRRLGESYRKLHGSEDGLGDLSLAAYDRTAALLESRRVRLRQMDVNFGASDPMEFTLTGLDGTKLELAALKSKVVVLDFWATWCAPCLTQHPMYETVKQRFEDRPDVVFLAIDTDEDRQLVAPFLGEQNWNRTVYFEDGLQRLLQVTSIPTTLLFDKRGRVASRMNGFDPSTFVDQLTERIRGALAEPAP